MIQLSLLQETSIKKTIITVPIEQLKLSRFNPRATRPDEDIDKLAQRIARNGFEITRALWAYRNGSGYEVFAGGTRLEAAKRSGVKKIPVVLHEGLTDEDVVRLADEDNENDEYHTSVSILDEWENYHNLYTEWGDLEKVAKAKGKDIATVSLKKNLHLKLPQFIKKGVLDNLLDEGHCIAISSVILDVQNFSRWLTTEQAQIELTREVLSKHRGSSNGIKPTVRNVREAAGRWKEMIALAGELYNKLDSQWQGEFVNNLAQSAARTKAQVQAAYNQTVQKQLEEARRREEELARQQNEMEAERIRLERERELQARIQDVLDRVILGDAVEFIEQAPDGIKLLLTDPSYGKEFQSNRRVTSPKRDRLENDDEQAFHLLRTILEKIRLKMAGDSTLFIFSSSEFEPEFRQIVKNSGYTWKGTYIWEKPNHGIGDLNGAFAPKHECIIHAVKGKPVLRKRPSSVLQGKEFLGSGHPTEKPVDLIKILIEATTDERDTIADPFAGSGSVLLTAYRLGRRIFGGDIDPTYHRLITDALYDLATKEFDHA